jgi:hypothetical protein
VNRRLLTERHALAAFELELTLAADGDVQLFLPVVPVVVGGARSNAGGRSMVCTPKLAIPSSASASRIAPQ